LVGYFFAREALSYGFVGNTNLPNRSAGDVKSDIIKSPRRFIIVATFRANATCIKDIPRSLPAMTDRANPLHFLSSCFVLPLTPIPARLDLIAVNGIIMKTPRIKIWLPLFGLLASFSYFSIEAYLNITNALEDDAVRRKTPDSLLFKKVFTSPVPSSEDDPAVREQIIRLAIAKTHKNTLVSVYQYKDEDMELVADNRDDINGRIPIDVESYALHAVRTWRADGEGFRLTDGRRFKANNVEYHVIGQEFQMTKKGDVGLLLLVTNLDSTIAVTSQIFIQAKLKTGSAVIFWGLLAIVINVVPVAKLTKQIKAGQLAKTAWWAPQPIEDLAAQLNLDKIANDRYREEVALERKMVEIAPVMLVRCKLPKNGKQAIFTYVNPAVKDQLGWAPLIGQPLNTIVPPEYGGYHTWMGLYDDDLKREVGMSKCPMHNHKSRVVESVRPVQAITANGETVDVLLSVQILDPDEDGSLNFAGTMIDVTALVKARAKAEALAEQIQVVNHIAVHDIKADLTALNKGSEVIQETLIELKDYLGASTDDVLVDAIDTVEYFSGLNINVLDQRNKLYNLEATIQITDTSIAELLESLRASFSSESGELRIYNDTPATAAIKADRSLILGSLKNIVRNGFIHNDSSLKRVEIKITPQDRRRVKMVVSDNGRGMPESYLAKWGQTMGKSAQLRNDVGGSGLGLYSIRSIINAHKNVTIDVVSEIGVGSSFTLEFDYVA
jgi:signal transduction histidine kinase